MSFKEVLYLTVTIKLQLIFSLFDKNTAGFWRTISYSRFCSSDYQQYLTGSCDLNDIAVRVLTRVIGHYPDREQILIDCGWTGLSHDSLGKLKTGFCYFEGHPNLKYVCFVWAIKHCFLNIVSVVTKLAWKGTTVTKQWLSQHSSPQLQAVWGGGGEGEGEGGDAGLKKLVVAWLPVAN